MATIERTKLGGQEKQRYTTIPAGKVFYFQHEDNLPRLKLNSGFILLKSGIYCRDESAVDGKEYSIYPPGAEWTIVQI